MKLEYEYGNCAIAISKEDDGDWEEALFQRTKNHGRAIREGKTYDSQLSKIIKLLNTHKKLRIDTLSGIKISL